MTTRLPRHVVVAIAWENALRQERRRIRSAQRVALRALRSILADTACLADYPIPGCTAGNQARGGHAEDCPYGQLRNIIRSLGAATRETGR